MPQGLGEWIASVGAGRGEFLALTVAVFVVVGALLEGLPALLIFGPILFPIAHNVGLDPVHYGTVIIAAMGIAFFLPPVAVILPIFLLFRGWKLYDTHVGLVLAYTFMTLPLTVWMMYAYFRQLPKSLEEAALVDGLSRWQTLWKIAVPLAAPGIVAAAVFAFIAVWTEFFFALILTSRHAFTLPTVFRAFLGFQGAQYGEACALATTSLVPSLILGMLVQRHLVRGLTLGAIRG
mgnify:CR=1 FL=1